MGWFPLYGRMVIREENAGVWYSRGQVFCTAKRFDRAIACYDRALELSPDDPIVWRRKGFALLKAGRHGEAAASFDQALTIDPGDATTWQRKAYALSCLGEHEWAIACCDTALMLDPGYILAWQNRGWLFGAICRHGGAAIAANPGRGPAAWHRERVHERIDLEALTSEIREAEGLIEVPACILEVAAEQDYGNAGLARAVLQELVGRAGRPAVRGL